MHYAGTWLFQSGVGNPEASCLKSQTLSCTMHRYFALVLFLFSGLNTLAVYSPFRVISVIFYCEGLGDHIHAEGGEG